MSGAAFDKRMTAAALEQPPAAATGISRQAVVIGDDSAPLFGWYHTDGSAPARDCVAVICNPMGHEYTHSYRSLRHLGDRLARAGMPALRFDYHGTGNSPGDAFDPQRLTRWQNDIRAAIAKAQALSGCRRVCLLGLRLGATLAALVATQAPVDYLVLWSPCVNGRRYVREMKAIAAAADDRDPDESWLESAGFIVSAETAADLQGVNLLQLPQPLRGEVLIAERDDLSEDRALADQLAAAGTAVDYRRLPGFADMMAEPQFAVVPDAALTAIIDWLSARLSAQSAPHPAALQPAAPVMRFEQPLADGGAALLTERPCRFGGEQHLFGIISYAGAPDTGKPAVVLLNSGSVHHVGPNRLYVMLARALSAAGFICLRMDIEGIGDSVPRGSTARENHPYQDSAVADTDSAMRFLETELQCRHFVIVGLCSGAHTAFHAGIELHDRAIDDVILINPLTFQWVEGMSLETTQHFQDVAYYRKSMRSGRSWMKLLQGKVNIFYVAGVALSQLRVLLKSSWDSLREVVLRKETTKLSADLGKLLKQRPLTLFISSNDPGYDILLAGAKRATLRAIRQQKIHLQFIEGADHTFSRLAKRTALIQHLSNHLKQRFGAKAP